MTTPQQPPRRPRASKGLSRGERLIVSSPFIVLVLLNAWYFPYATDDPVDRNEELAAFYGMAYEENAATAAAYAQATRRAREAVNLKNRVETFIRDYDLQDRKVLDVGSGDGYLQDLVADYTGLDIAKTAARYYHKPLVHGTATAMPFEHNTFDAIWTIWVLEHIPNPEAALAEMRRVVKPGGLLYLHPAWNCVPWAANGYEVRPYSDFGLGGKIIKASVPMGRHPAFGIITTVPSRMVRVLAWPLGPSRLHYRRLEPNYEQYLAERQRRRCEHRRRRNGHVVSNSRRHVRDLRERLALAVHPRRAAHHPREQELVALYSLFFSVPR